MPQDAATVAVRVPGAHEVVPNDARDPVMAREPLVHEGVIGSQQVEETPVLTQLTREEQRRLPEHVGPQVLVELEEHVGRRVRNRCYGYPPACGR